MISIDLPKHIRAKCSGPAAVFAISSWRTRRLCASCKPAGGRVVLDRKKWLTGTSLGVGTLLVDGNIPQGNKGCCDMCLCSPLCCEDITIDSYILTTLTSHQLLHNFHSVFRLIQATEAVTICRETFANAFITHWYLKSESLNFNTTCVTMVAKFLYYMSLWRRTLEIIINLSDSFWMVFSSTLCFLEMFLMVDIRWEAMTSHMFGTGSFFCDSQFWGDEYWPQPFPFFLRGKG